MLKQDAKDLIIETLDSVIYNIAYLEGDQAELSWQISKIHNQVMNYVKTLLESK